MTSVLRTNLNEAVRGCILELSAQGRFATHEVTQLVIDRYAALVEEYSDRLVKAEISDIARKMMKRPTPKDTGQISLFPESVQRLDLPQLISLPPEGADPEVEHSEEEYTWIELRTATFAELTLHIALLETNIARSQRRLLNLRELHNVLAPVMSEGRSEEAIYPVLEELGRLERTPN